MRDDTFPLLFFGVFLGTLLSVSALHIFSEDVDMKKSCEINLPRNQHCVKQWVPAPQGETK